MTASASSGQTHEGTIAGSAVGVRGLEYVISSTIGGVTRSHVALDDPALLDVTFAGFNPGGALNTTAQTHRMISFAADVGGGTVVYATHANAQQPPPEPTALTSTMETRTGYPSTSPSARTRGRSSSMSAMSQLVPPMSTVPLV